MADSVWEPQVSLVGVGGLGSQAALALARHGYRLQLFDPDTVEAKNLQNQAYLQEHIGQAKVKAMGDLLRRIQPTETGEFIVRVDGAVRFTTHVVVSAVDSLAARRAILDACLASSQVKHLVDARAGGIGLKVHHVVLEDTAAVAGYRETLVEPPDLGPQGPPCLTVFTSHMGMISAGLIVRAVDRAMLGAVPEAQVVFDVETLRVTGAEYA